MDVLEAVSANNLPLFPAAEQPGDQGIHGPERPEVNL